MDVGDKNSLLIYKYYLDLVYYTNTLCIKYPKSEKLALASETKQSLYSGLRELIYALKEYNKKNKISHLNNLDVELNLQKVYLRLAYKYKYISRSATSIFDQSAIHFRQPAPPLRAILTKSCFFLIKIWQVKNFNLRNLYS